MDIDTKISQFVKSHHKELKTEEQTLQRNMTKFDIAQYMLCKGALKESEFIEWMNTKDGFESSKISEQRDFLLQSGNIWDFSGKNSESYLDTVLKDNNDKKATNAIYGLDINPEIFEKNPIHQEIVARYQLIETPNVTYTELMNYIAMQNMSNEEQLEMTLKLTGEKFYEAKEKGDKETMKATLLQGFGLVFAVMDENLGITDFKEFLKDITGLNKLVEMIDNYVDNGEESLSFAEKSWSAVKGAGNSLDAMIGTKSLAFVGSLNAATQMAAASGLGKIFSIGLQSVYAYNGLSETYQGISGLFNADTEDEAYNAGQSLMTGGMLLYGTYKTGKQCYDNYKATEAKLAAEITGAEKTLGLEGNYTMQSLKEAYRELCKTQHPDKGGTIESFDKITDAYNLLLKNFNKRTILKPEVEPKVKSDSKVGNLPVPSKTSTTNKVDVVKPAAVAGVESVEGMPDVINSQRVEVPTSDINTVSGATDIVQTTVGRISEFPVTIPGINHFSGYRNPDGSINIEAFTKHIQEVRKASINKGNSVEKVIIDGFTPRDLETFVSDYPLFTQYYVNAMENGLALNENNLKSASDCSYSDANLVKYTEEYLAKGLKFEDFTNLREVETKSRISHNKRNSIQKFSPEIQQKYIDFMYNSTIDLNYSDKTNSLNFIIENIKDETFIKECLENPNKLNEITSIKREFYKLLEDRSKSKSYEITYRDLMDIADLDKISSQLVLMKMYYPENYEKLLKSEGLRAVIWNFKPITLRTLENIQYDKPVTDTNLAGVDVSQILKDNNVITEKMAQGNKATNFNASDRVGNLFREKLTAHAESKNLSSKETSLANGGTKFTLYDNAHNVIKSYQTGTFNTKKIEQVEQGFYNKQGREELRVKYSAQDNKFEITNGYKTETLYSLKEFKARYPNYRFDPDIQSFIWVNDNGFHSRAAR